MHTWGNALYTTDAWNIVFLYSCVVQQRNEVYVQQMCLMNGVNMVSLHDLHYNLILLIFLQSLMHLVAAHVHLVATTRVTRLTSGSGAGVVGLWTCVHVGAAAILTTP